jgi:hypothetical protein
MLSDCCVADLLRGAANWQNAELKVAPERPYPMSLAFALLQKDYIVLAADRRHTRGDDRGGYVNDNGLKTEEILGGKGVLGFAGEDIGESIIHEAKAKGIFNQLDLHVVASELSKLSKDKYLNWQYKPDVHFLLAGFALEWSGESVATAWTMRSLDRVGPFNPSHASYPNRKFEVIGKSDHGALYSLHRFGGLEDPLAEIAATRLSAFTICEICKCDNSCGGLPNIYVIPKHGECRLVDNIPTLVEWAKNVGASLRDAIVSGAVPPGFKHDL